MICITRKLVPFEGDTGEVTFLAAPVAAGLVGAGAVPTPLVLFAGRG